MHCRLITWQDPLFLHFIPLVLLVVLPLLLAGERFCIYISHRCSSVCTQQIKEKAKEKSRYAVHPTVHINRSLPTCVLSKALHKVGKRKASSLILLVAWLKPNRGHPLWWWREACRWYISCRYKFGNLLCTIHALQTDWCETRTPLRPQGRCEVSRHVSMISWKKEVIMQ